MRDIDLFLCLLPRLKIEKLIKLHENFSQTEFIENIAAEDLNSALSEKYISKPDFETVRTFYYKLIKENETLGIKSISYFDELYPEKLKNISTIPRILYIKGNETLLNADMMLGSVGSRKPSAYGIWATKSLVKDLAVYGFCIVSGMAKGIDAISHRAAIDNDAKTICVLGTPLNKIYPAANKKLYYDAIESGGLIVSERNVFETTVPAHFALRNRIISGLSDGLLIIEAGSKSGTLITANYALEQGKTVFAVPGNINLENSKGTNKLIKDGACMVTSVADILNEFGFSFENAEKLKDVGELSESENLVLKFVKAKGSVHAESLALESGLKIQDAVALLNILSIKGYIDYDGFVANYINK